MKLIRITISFPIIISTIIVIIGIFGMGMKIGFRLKAEASPLCLKEEASSLPISMNRWDKAFANILKEEGEYSNNPSDPGGETKWGISKISYPHIDIKNLTKEQAEAIYKKDFWEPIRGDHLHDDTLAVEVMEEAVNMGKVVAIKFLQTAVMVAGGKIELDGQMGPTTIEEIKKHDPKVLLACIKAQSMSYYMSLVHQHPALRKFLKGWFNRVLN